MTTAPELDLHLGIGFAWKVAQRSSAGLHGVVPTCMENMRTRPGRKAGSVVLPCSYLGGTGQDSGIAQCCRSLQETEGVLNATADSEVSLAQR